MLPPHLVEDSESFPDLLLTVRVLHLPGHHSQELGEVDGSVAFVDTQTQLSHLQKKSKGPKTVVETIGILTVGVHLVDHVLKLGLGGVLPQGAHHRPELLGGDGAVAVFIEQRERLLELCKGSVGAPEKHNRLRTQGI